MLTQGPVTETSSAALPDWARPPAMPPDPQPPDRARGSVVRGVVVRVTGAGAVAIALLLLGHTLGAVVLLTVLGVSSALSLTVPAVGRGIDRFIVGFQALVGKGLTLVLLGLVHLVLFVPVSLVLRLLRKDPLALGATPEDPTFWRGAARRRKHRSLYNRPFAYERHPAVAGTRRRAGLLQVLGALVAVGLADLGVGRLMGVQDDPATGPASTREFQTPSFDGIAAADQEPWAAQLFEELDVNLQAMRYHPYRTRQMSDIRGEYVNVTDGVRRSYQSQLAGDSEPIDVYFFGGSAMMGWYQRDEHTIASEFARLAEADGIDVRVVNRGTPAYNNWQEQLLLEELVTAGERPDLAVFYDGINEIGAQFRSPGEAGQPTHMYADDVAASLDAMSRSLADAGDDEDSPFERMADAYSSQSAIGEVVRRVRGTDGADTNTDGHDRQPGVEVYSATNIFIPWPHQSDDPEGSGRTAAELHGRGVDATQALAEYYGFRTAFFWQPSVYTRPEVGGEEPTRGSWGTDPAAWTTASDAARGHLHDDVVDLSNVLDEVDEPVMYDFVHTNERGARIVAQAIYDQLKPTLLDLSQ